MLHPTINIKIHWHCIKYYNDKAAKNIGYFSIRKSGILLMLNIFEQLNT